MNVLVSQSLPGTRLNLVYFPLGHCRVCRHLTLPESINKHLLSAYFKRSNTLSSELTSFPYVCLKKSGPTLPSPSHRQTLKIKQNQNPFKTKNHKLHLSGCQPTDGLTKHICTVSLASTAVFLFFLLQHIFSTRYVLQYSIVLYKTTHTRLAQWSWFIQKPLLESIFNFYSNLQEIRVNVQAYIIYAQDFIQMRLPVFVLLEETIEGK